MKRSIPLMIFQIFWMTLLFSIFFLLFIYTPFLALNKLFFHFDFMILNTVIIVALFISILVSIIMVVVCNYGSNSKSKVFVINYILKKRK